MAPTPSDSTKNIIKEKTVMTNDEFLDMIHECFVDEISSVNKYMGYYDFALKNNKGYEAEVLIRIANDEESHARYLLRILDGNGYKISESEMLAYNEMEDNFRH